MPSQIHIVSGEYQASFFTKGAELCSLKHIPSQFEFIWQNKDLSWSRHAPILFPIVGRCKDFKYQYNSKQYDIEQHGFARDLDFEIEHLDINAITFVLKQNEYTLLRYPFQFIFKVHYLLKEHKLFQHFEIINSDIKNLPFSVGAHPAFNIDLNHTYIKFKNQTSITYQLLDQNNLIAAKEYHINLENSLLTIDNQLFKDDALIISNPIHEIEIINKKQNKSIKIMTNLCPFLGIWAKPNSDFVCIEPWWGIADFEETDSEILNKKGIQIIEPNSTWKASFEIDFYNH